ncbi:MAG: hypothetical protein ABI315_13560, partial [Bacteroidia bacterium]
FVVPLPQVNIKGGVNAFKEAMAKGELKVEAILDKEGKAILDENDNALSKAITKDGEEVLVVEKVGVQGAGGNLVGLIKDSRGVYGYLSKEDSRYYAFVDKFMDPEWVGRQRAIRQDYLKQSEVLEQTIITMRGENKTPEQIGRHVVEQRNLQKVEARSHMLPDEVKALEVGNIKRYGNPIGPSADDLFNSKGSWEDVIEGSMKKDPEINTLLGL